MIKTTVYRELSLSAKSSSSLDRVDDAFEKIPTIFSIADQPATASQEYTSELKTFIMPDLRRWGEGR